MYEVTYSPGDKIVRHGELGRNFYLVTRVRSPATCVKQRWEKQFFLWYGRGSICHCRFRIRQPYKKGLNRQVFLQPKPDFTPAKGVLLPSQAGSTTPHQP